MRSYLSTVGGTASSFLDVRMQIVLVVLTNVLEELARSNSEIAVCCTHVVLLEAEVVFISEWYVGT